ILMITSAAKFYSLFEMQGKLHVRDPLLYLRTDMLLVLVGSLEIAVAAIILSPGSFSFKLRSILWLSSMLLVYRIGLFGIGYRKPCLCAGSPNSWLMLLNPSQMDFAMKIVLLYMLLFSLSFILYDLWERRFRSRSSVK